MRRKINCIMNKLLFNFIFETTFILELYCNTFCSSSHSSLSTSDGNLDESFSFPEPAITCPILLVYKYFRIYCEHARIRRFPGCASHLRFPLENLGVAPVLCRSSSQTLYLCVGVNIGVSSILWCDLRIIETTNAPTIFTAYGSGMVSAVVYMTLFKRCTWILLRIILFHVMNILCSNNIIIHHIQKLNASIVLIKTKDDSN